MMVITGLWARKTTMSYQEDDELEHESRISANRNKWVIPAIKEWMKKEHVRFDVGSNSFFVGAVNTSMQDVSLFARVTFNGGTRKLTRDSALYALKRIAIEARAEAVAEAIERIVVPARTDDKALRTWLREMLVADIAPDEYENCVVVMKQWMWLVQRALLNKEQQWHIMPIFWGPQGGGKSTQVARLLEPLGAFWAKNSFQVMMGQFDALPMHWNYALFLDEMASASRAEAARVKACIDSKVIPGRGMFTDDGRALVRNASFIAATNEPPPHGLMDSTGGRRFYSLECRNTPVVGARAEFFARVNYAALWYCVDPHGPAPILARREQIAIVQHEVNRAPGSIERFLVEGCEKSDSDLRLTDFRDAFSEYCKRCGLHFSFPAQAQVVRLLESLGVAVKRHENRFILKNISVL